MTIVLENIPTQTITGLDQSVSDTRLIQQAISKYTLRWYQRMSVDRAEQCLRAGKSAALVLATGAGKSIVIAYLCARFPDKKFIIFQPSREILLQNYEKLTDVAPGMDIGIHSASVGLRGYHQVTLATIGSVRKYPDRFSGYDYVIIDECHNVNPSIGEYQKFLLALGSLPTIGLTATPFRTDHSAATGPQFEVITNMFPRIFDDILVTVQMKQMLQEGFLSPLTYTEFSSNFDVDRVRREGMDYDEAHLEAVMKHSGFFDSIPGVVYDLIVSKKRNKVLVFARSIRQCKEISAKLNKVGIPTAVVSSETKKTHRTEILKEFAGDGLKCVICVKALAVGYDHPGIDAIVDASPTRSFVLQIQKMGRGARRKAGKKDCLIVDMVGNYRRFGRVEDIEVRKNQWGKWCAFSNGIMLNNRDIR